ncbi:MAG: PEGA domain-containing protein [Candidatus Acidiferrales bacterium]
MVRIAAALILSAGLYSLPAGAQQGSPNADQRDVLQQILSQSYQPSQVGKGLMGIGTDTAIRRAGTIVVVQRPGLYASFNRNEIASSAIRGMEASLYRGNKDYEVPVGERYYVFNVAVVEDNVTIALLSARVVNGPKGAGRVWTALTFYFPAQTLANADKDDVFRAIDPWLAPEGHFAGSSGLAPVSSPVGVAAQPGYPPQAAPAAAPVARPAAATPPSPPAHLAPGMTRDEIVAALGAPQREMSFEGKSWLTYSNMVIVLEGGKLKSIDQSAQPPARVAVHSDPSGAEIYLDGQLIGSTPSSVELPAGNHELSVRLSGYQDWTRTMRVLSGSEINLEAKLEKK